MRSKFATCLLAAGLLTLALGQAALAGTPAAGAATDDMFAAMDANKDGVLTKEEFTAHGMGDDFAKYDTNGDGKVTPSEYDAVTAKSGKMNMPGM
uniref:EF-hand domain-containing protein n=1 Tax=Desulfovibrio sp. U5L TaxID=596152 RepID=I2Q5T7_9BACT